MKFRRIVFLIGILVLSLGAISFVSIKYLKAHSSVRTITQYNTWLNDKERGCYISHTIAGIQISVKYQPPAYMVLKELEGMQGNIPAHNNWDSLFKKQKNMLSFLMTISPVKPKDNTTKRPLMYEGVDNFQQYAERIMATNFSMNEHMKLYIDGIEYAAVITVAENVYELSDDHNFLVVFVPAKIDKAYESKEMRFVYEDPFFEMGKVQFGFNTSDLEKANRVNVRLD